MSIVNGGTFSTCSTGAKTKELTEEDLKEMINSLKIDPPQYMLIDQHGALYKGNSKELAMLLTKRAFEDGLV